MPKSRIGEGIGELNSVIFSAADIEMIKGDPVSRRNYINLEISQIFPAYIQNYANYKKTLTQRNNILKDIKNNIRESYDLLDVLDIQLSIWGAELISKRQEFINKINLYSKEIYNITSDENSGFDIKYLSNPYNEAWDKNSLRENIMAHLKEKRDTDIKMGTTVTGPHRDDISIKINNYPVKYYGSGGEMRSAAFALKMSEIEIIKEVWEEYPIVLLDDLMSELDINRREKAVEIAQKNCQVFITTTHLDNISYNKEETSLYYLEKGKLAGEEL
ncbi:MAG: DNA replication and repair protein RecF [Armatimonadetes bacterium]|nr:DNA replication and repair protein RecF [Candidatus Hippobium faecium]